MRVFKFQKLVRDNIVPMQLSLGAEPTYRILDKDGHIRALIDKIIEETQEIRTADKESVSEEIADIQQALDDLLLLSGIT